MLVDVLGFLLGIDQEYNGIIWCGVKLFYVYGEVIVLKIMVIICKVYGGVYCVMGFKDMGCDVNLVWLIVQIVVMGVFGVVGFVYCQQLVEVVVNGEDIDKLWLWFQQEYEDILVNLYVVVECGYVDVVILLLYICGYIGIVLWLLECKIVQLLFKKYGNVFL